MGVGVSRSSLAGAVAKEGGIGVISTAQIGYDEDAYLWADEDDVVTVQSPVGMPGRALHNVFMQNVETKREPITKCYQCLEHCNPAKVPYCITKALVNAVKGDLDHGLICCGANVGRIKKLMSVHDLMLSMS